MVLSSSTDPLILCLLMMDGALTELEDGKNCGDNESRLAASVLSQF